MRNRAIGALIGVAVAAMLLSWQSRRTESLAWDLLPENEGAIRTVALQYCRPASAMILPVYRSFLSSLGPDVEVMAVCGSRDEAREFERAVSEWHLAKPKRIRTLVVGKPITGWCKDRFLVARSSSSLLVCPKVEETGIPGRTNDSLVAPTLAHALPDRIHAVDAPLEFDSGDILATRTRIIVSDSLWRKNARPRDFKERLKAMFGREVVWLKGVPDHHIGMFAAPLDDRTVVVGDPRLGKRLWPQTSEAFRAANPQPDFSDRVSATFDRAAAQLQEAGFRVIRAPLLPYGPKTFITCTNGIFEARGGRKTVYMPCYGDSVFDGAGRRAYESAGWRVKPIQVGQLYRCRGTIGCLVNVLERG